MSATIERKIFHQNNVSNFRAVFLLAIYIDTQRKSHPACSCTEGVRVSMEVIVIANSVTKPKADNDNMDFFNRQGTGVEC